MTYAAILDWLGNNWEEVAGVVTGLAYLFFAVRQSILLWALGILSAVFFIVVFFRAEVYGNMVLQTYYLVMSIYGWIHWAKGTKRTSEHSPKGPLPVTRLSLRPGAIALLVSLLAFLPVYFLLRDIVHSPVPFLDAVTSVLSMTATWMLARKIIENWLVWIAVDAVSSFMYYSRELYFTAFLYAVYATVAILGFLAWKKTMQVAS
ncbi:MAG: nicotinamide mononucleotide transporter [Bacteroidales bacterium]|nr:nicotinamide mononucleotide transporter [Bacteroidales bacterium]